MNDDCPRRLNTWSYVLYGIQIFIFDTIGSEQAQYRISSGWAHVRCPKCDRSLHKHMKLIF